MPEPAKFRVLTLNSISHLGLKRLPADRYHVGGHVDDPDAILVRSADLHAFEFGDRVRAVGRAGAGTNNIPVPQLSARGIPVFNAPGGNANAVKELVLAGMLLAARHLVPALNFVSALTGDDDATLAMLVESGKKQFAGVELPHHTLGIVGLGRIGSLVADAAIKLGMSVIGYDPEITVDAAWSLPSSVKRAHSLDEVLKASDFVTLHVPLNPATKHMVDAPRIALMRNGAVLLNFSREGIVDAPAVAAALEAKKLKYYVCDFPQSALLGHPHVIALPHLGASTREAEDNCAVMVADQVREYLEHGNIRNAVNFPDVEMARESPFRIGIAHANVPNMLGQISSALGEAKLNIHTMVNKSKAQMAYTLLDVDSAASADALASLRAIDGVLAVRWLPAEAWAPS